MSSRRNTDYGTPLHANGITSNQGDTGMPQDSMPDQFQHPMTLDEVHIETLYAHLSHEVGTKLRKVCWCSSGKERMKLLTTYATTTLAWTICRSEPLLRCFSLLVDMR